MGEKNYFISEGSIEESFRTFSETNCVIWLKSIECNPVRVGPKGLATLIIVSQSQGHYALCNYLSERASASPPGKVRVHGACRREYTHTS